MTGSALSVALDRPDGDRGTGTEAHAAGGLQCLWLHRFTDLVHAERKIGAFIERYNTEGWSERHDHCTPRAIRAKLQAAT